MLQQRAREAPTLLLVYAGGVAGLNPTLPLPGVLAAICTEPHCPRLLFGGEPLQVEVQRPADMETTSLGAAFAAGIGSGFWTAEWVLGGASQDAASSQQDAVFLPKVRPLCISPLLIKGV